MDFTVISMSGQRHFPQELLCKNCWKPPAVVCPHFQSQVLNFGWKNPAEFSAPVNPHLQLNAADGISYSHLITSMPSKDIDLLPVLCCLPSAGVWESCWWELGLSNLLCTSAARVCVEMLVIAHFRWLKFHWNAQGKPLHLQLVFLPLKFSGNYALFNAWNTNGI